MTVVNKKIHVAICCDAGPSVGLGHLSRMLFLAKSLRADHNMEVSVAVLSPSEIKLKQLYTLPHEYYLGSFVNAVYRILKTVEPEVMIYDLSLERMKETNPEVFRSVRKLGCYQIGIDNLLRYSDVTDFTLVPAFRINSRYKEFIKKNVRWGWDSFLIPLPGNVQATRNNKLLVLTGSSDTAGLGKILPQLFNEKLSVELEINWVQGPLAEAPVIPQNPKHTWVLHVAPEGLGELMSNCSYGLSVYGVSLFELISYKIPSVTLSPYNGRDEEDMQALETDGIALYGSDPANATQRVNELLSSYELFQSMQQTCSHLMQKTGVNTIAELIHSASNRENTL